MAFPITCLLNCPPKCMTHRVMYLCGHYYYYHMYPLYDDIPTATMHIHEVGGVEAALYPISLFQSISFIHFASDPSHYLFYYYY
jgi:hypothetical protein